MGKARQVISVKLTHKDLFDFLSQHLGADLGNGLVNSVDDLSVASVSVLACSSSDCVNLTMIVEAYEDEDEDE